MWRGEALRFSPSNEAMFFNVWRANSAKLKNHKAELCSDCSACACDRFRDLGTWKSCEDTGLIKLWNADLFNNVTNYWQHMVALRSTSQFISCGLNVLKCACNLMALAERLAPAVFAVVLILAFAFCLGAAVPGKALTPHQLLLMGPLQFAIAKTKSPWAGFSLILSFYGSSKKGTKNANMEKFSWTRTFEKQKQQTTTNNTQQTTNNQQPTTNNQQQQQQQQLGQERSLPPYWAPVLGAVEVNDLSGFFVDAVPRIHEDCGDSQQMHLSQVRSPTNNGFWMLLVVVYFLYPTAFPRHSFLRNISNAVQKLAKLPVQHHPQGWCYAFARLELALGLPSVYDWWLGGAEAWDCLFDSVI